MTSVPGSDIPILIPAAGLSSRMRGDDKLMRRIDGVSLLRRQILRACDATRGAVIVMLPPAPHDRYSCLSGTRATAVDVPDARDGLSASLKRGLKALPQGSPAAMILLPDLPEITTGDIRKVLAPVGTDDTVSMWCATTEDGKPGHPMVLDAKLFDDFLTLSGDSGARMLRKREEEKNALQYVPLAGNRARLDLDTPEDWAAWEADRK